MIIWIYVVVSFLGLWSGYLLKVRFTGPDLSIPVALLCILFACFLVCVHLGVAFYQDLLFFGDITRLLEKHPVVIFFSLISAFVQAAFLPLKTEPASDS
ncbi:MAG: hypothetical protein RSE94_13950 [Pseudomonas sp.]